MSTPLETPSSYSPNTLDLINEDEAAHIWFRCLADLFNNFTTEAESSRIRTRDHGTVDRSVEFKTEYLLCLGRLEEKINSHEPLSIRRLLDINEDCLRIYCFDDSWLEQRVIEHRSSVVKLRNQLNEIDVLRREEKWLRLVKELVAGKVFAIFTEILDDKTSGSAESDRWSDIELGILIRIIKCLESWERKIGGYQIDKSQQICEVLLKVINKSYWPCIERGDGRMSALENEVAECAANTLEIIITQRLADRYPQTAFILIKLLLDSLSRITKAECEGNKNELIAANIYRLITSACKKHIELVLTGITTTDQELADLYRRIVAEVLQATTKPGVYPVDELCSSEALTFWFSLAYEAYDICDEDEKEKCLEHLKPFLVELTHILLKKAQHPDENITRTWTEDDLEKFNYYRGDIWNAFRVFYDILQHAMLEIFSGLLNEGIVELQTNPMSWAKLEVGIFAFYSIAEYLTDIKTDDVPKLMEVMSEIPYENHNDKLLEMVLKTTQSYSCWFRQNPNYLAIAVQLLVKGLNSSMSCNAINSLNQLCCDCQKEMAPYAEQLLDACNSSLPTGRIISGVGKLISVLPAEKIPTYLDPIVNACFDELQKICQAGEKNPTSKITTVSLLNTISELFGSLNTNVWDCETEQEVNVLQPVVVVLQKTMPLFRQTAEFWIDDNEVIEAVCGVVWNTMRNLKMDLTPLLDDYCTFFLSVYQRRPCPTVLRLSGQFAGIYKQEKQQRTTLQEMLSQIVLYTFKSFEKTPEEEFPNIIGTIEAFRDWIIDLMDFLLEVNVDFSKLTSYVLKILALPDYQLGICSVRFLKLLIKKSGIYPNMRETVLNQGEAIVRSVIVCVACNNHIGRNHVEALADVLQALNKGYCAELVGWLQILDTPNFPNSRVSKEEKKLFAMQMIKEDSNEHDIQMHVKEFAAKCRGLERL